MGIQLSDFINEENIKLTNEEIRAALLILEEQNSSDNIKEENEMNKIITVESDYDGSPVVVYLGGFGTLLSGDLYHNQGWEYFVNGFIDGVEMSTGSRLEVERIYIEGPEDVEEHEEFLKEVGCYTEYQDIVGL